MSKAKEKLGKNVARNVNKFFYDSEKPSSSHILKLNYRHHSREWCTQEQTTAADSEAEFYRGSGHRASSSAQLSGGGIGSLLQPCRIVVLNPIPF